MPGDVEQRAENAVVAKRADAAQGPESAAGEKTHEDRLGLVVFLVSGGDPVGPGRDADLLEQPEPDVSCRRFDAAPPDLRGVDRAVADVDGDVKSLAKPAEEPLVLVRVRTAEMMVDVRAGDGKPLGAQVGHREKEGGRVDAARRRKDDVRRFHTVTHEKVADFDAHHAVRL